MESISLTASSPHLKDFGKMKVLLQLLNPKTHTASLSLSEISMGLQPMAQKDELW